MKSLRAGDSTEKSLPNRWESTRHLPLRGMTRTLVTAASAMLAATAAAVVLGAAPAKVQKSAQTSPPAAESSGNASKGRQLYKKDGCYECHGLEGQGSQSTGPRLGPDPIPLEAFITYIRQPAGAMPVYTAKVVSDQELTDIYAFLKSLPPPKK
jgi:mono/diheme cytochrome c family protein